MKHLILLFAFFIVATSFAQTLIASFKPVDSKYNWGCFNQEGKVLIEPSYKGAFDFNEAGIAPVFDLKTKSWSYITIDNKKLNVNLKSFEPNSIMGFGRTGFQNGVAIVVVKKKKGVINLEGKLIHEPIFEFISHFENGFATAKRGSEFFILNTKGESSKLSEPIVAIKKFSNGLALFRGKNDLFGYLNVKGEVVIKPQFVGAGQYNGDIAWAKNTSKKVGFINQKGDWVIEAQYLAAKNMNAKNEIARVKNESGWLFVKKDGTEIKAEGATSYGDFHEGLAYARKGKLFGFINVRGEWIIEPTYLKVKNFHDGFTAVRTLDQWGFINSKGEVIFKEQAKAIRNFKNGYAAVANMENLWGFINTKGEWVIDPIYTKVKDFNLVK